MQKVRVWPWLLVGVLLILLAGALIGSARWLYAAPASQSLLPTPTPPPFEAANELEDQVVHLYETARGSVVNITNRGYTADQFMQPVPQEGTGSGFVYDNQGHIVTNYHVVENAEELIVTLADGSNHTAELVGQDPSNDLAVIHIDADTLPPALPLADGDTLRVGQFVIAIGNPFGLQGTLTVGVISSLGRVIESPNGRFIGEAIQTDAAINPGNSGGPLLNLAGEVIGVNSQIASTSGASAGIGFAVPAEAVRRVADQLISQGYYSHPWLGVQTVDIGPNQAQLLRDAGMDVPVDQGVLVVDVVDSSPAAQGGVQGGSQTVRVGSYQVPIGGDIITAVNGEPVISLQALTVYLENETEVGDTVTLTVIRDGQTQDLQVTLAERPQEQ